MIYALNPSTKSVMSAAEQREDICFIKTPAQGNKIPIGSMWLADNGCFGKGYPGDIQYIKWLVDNKPHRKDCLFATAPDVVGDFQATTKRSAPFLPVIREIGYKVAYIAQDGMLPDSKVPWGEFDCLFIGGTTEFKLSEDAALIAQEAKSKGKWVHMGRVNSNQRIRYAEAIGCDSVDGTYITFGPDINLPKLVSWLDGLIETPPTPHRIGIDSYVSYRKNT